MHRYLRSAIYLLAPALAAGAVLAQVDQSSNAAAQRQIAFCLDQLLQPRFQRTDNGFGVKSRMASIRGHSEIGAATLSAATRQRDGREDGLLAQATTLNRDYVVMFLHTVPAAELPSQPGTATRTVTAGAPSPASRRHALDPLATRSAFGKFSSPQSASSVFDLESKFYRSDIDEIEKQIWASVKTINAGKHVSFDKDRWFVDASPVRVTKASCIGCHTHAKLGDTLGALVYAVDSNEIK